jgi:hypothetical protein
MSTPAAQTAITTMGMTITTIMITIIIMHRRSMM